MPVSDASYMLRASTEGALDANEQSASGVHVGPGPIQGMKVGVYCPAAGGSSPTLDVKMQECDDNSTWVDVPGGAVPQIDAAGYYELHFHWTGRYLRYHATVGGSTPDFGAVTIGLTPGEIATT
jgi:hypothetical protein